jgi:death-on-curing family protein
MNTGKIVIYQARDKQVRLDVKLERETVWLTQKQISKLFRIERSVITKHLRNIFYTKELSKDSVCAKIAHTASDGKAYQTTFYNLDVVISVGYRVNSKRATQFRIWATSVLKKHLLDGYTLNEKRLLEQEGKLRDLQRAIEFIEVKSHENLLEDQSANLLHVISEYAKSLTILEQYDSKRLVLQKTKKPRFVLTYGMCKETIAGLSVELTKKKEAGDLFGREADKRLEGIVKNLYQTFNKKELYQSLEEKSAHLLYFVIKDHPFADGNKRIAAMLFIYFLSRNNYLRKASGECKINDNALVALALLIATSEPKDKDIMIRVITNLLK